MLRDFLAEDKEKSGKEKSGKESKMLGQLHALDRTIEDFIGKLEDRINSIEENPMFVRKAHQLLANMSKEYSEFIMALRSIVNAVDRSGQMLPSVPFVPSKARDVNVNAEQDGEDEAEEAAASVGAPNESKITKFLEGK